MASSPNKKSVTLNIIKQRDFLNSFAVQMKGRIESIGDIDVILHCSEKVIRNLVLSSKRELITVLIHKLLTEGDDVSLHLDVCGIKKAVVTFQNVTNGIAKEFVLLNDKGLALYNTLEVRIQRDRTMARKTQKQIATLNKRTKNLHKSMIKQTKYATALEEKVICLLESSREFDIVTRSIGDGEFKTDFNTFREKQLTCVKTLVSSVKDEAIKLFVQREWLKSLTTTKEIKVQSLQQSLAGVKTTIQTTKLDSKKYTEECRGMFNRYKERTDQRCEKDRRANDQRMQQIEDEIADNNRFSFFREASNELCQRMNDMQGISEYGQYEFKAGATQSVYRTLGWTYDINMTDHDSCHQAFYKVMAEWENTLMRIESLRQERDDLRTKNTNLQCQRQYANITTDQLGDSVNKISQSTEGMITSIGPVLDVFQEMDRETDVAMKETNLFVKHILDEKRKAKWVSRPESTSQSDENEPIYTEEEQLEIFHHKLKYVDRNIGTLIRISSHLTDLLESAEDVLHATETSLKERIKIPESEEDTDPYAKELEILRRRTAQFEETFKELGPFVPRTHRMVEAFETAMHETTEINRLCKEVEHIANELLKSTSEQPEEREKTSDNADKRDSSVQTEIDVRSDRRFFPQQMLCDFEMQFGKLCEKLQDL